MFLDILGLRGAVRWQKRLWSSFSNPCSGRNFSLLRALFNGRPTGAVDCSLWLEFAVYSR